MNHYIRPIVIFFLLPLGLSAQNYEHANIDRYPYAVSIESSLNYRICSGVIISTYYVLSENTFGTDLIFGGIPAYVRYNSSSTLVDGTIVEIARVYAHPDYDYDSGINDISVVEVIEPFVFDNIVQPVALHENPFNLENGTVLTTAGWTYNSSFYLIDDHLVAVNVTYLDWNQCERTHYPLFLARTSLCVICTDADGNACFRDGGAPLVTANNILVGVYFWQLANNDLVEPAIYTNVTSVLDFIRNFVSV